MCSLSRCLSPSDQQSVFAATVLRHGTSQIKKAQVRMQDPHASLRLAQLASSTPRGSFPCKAVRSNRPILDEGSSLTDQSLLCKVKSSQTQRAKASWRAARSNLRRWRFKVRPDLLRRVNLYAWKNRISCFPYNRRNLQKNGEVKTKARERRKRLDRLRG